MLQSLNETYSIFPLGDAAATIDLGNIINELLNDKVIAMQEWLQTHPFTGQKDIIAAYSSLTVIYDPAMVKTKQNGFATVFDFAKSKLEEAFTQSVIMPHNQEVIKEIPVCYDDVYAMDLTAMATEKQMSKEEIIALHTERVYRVYTIGFLPGFSYMASVHQKLITPRKLKPVTVAAGSIGIAGEQTGIYPLESPGGWHIIGRTPLKQFDPQSTSLIQLKVGDRVRFYAIGKEEFERHKV